MHLGTLWGGSLLVASVLLWLVDGVIRPEVITLGAVLIGLGETIEARPTRRIARPRDPVLDALHDQYVRDRIDADELERRVERHLRREVTRG